MCRLPLLLLIALSMVAVPAIADDRKPVEIKFDLDKTDEEAIKIAESMLEAMKERLNRNKKFRIATEGDKEILTALIEFDPPVRGRWHQINGTLIRNYKKTNTLQQALKKWQIRSVRKSLYGDWSLGRSIHIVSKDFGYTFEGQLCDDTPEVETDLPFAN